MVKKKALLIICMFVLLVCRGTKNVSCASFVMCMYIVSYDKCCYSHNKEYNNKEYNFVNLRAIQLFVLQSLSS